MSPNNDIKEALKSANVKQWQVAERLKMNEFSFSRKLRHELTAEEKVQILFIINEIRSGR